MGLNPELFYLNDMMCIVVYLKKKMKVYFGRLS